MPIRELEGTTPEVVAIDGRHRLVRARSDAVWRVGVRQVLRLTLATGRSLRATAEHRVLAGAGWRKLSELQAGDRLALALTHEAIHQDGVAARGLAGLRGRSYGGTSHLAPAPSRETVAGCAQLLERQELEHSATGDVLWDRVISIEPDGEEDVYDLTVPGPACWLADSIVSHNSGAIEQDSDLVMFIYREEYYEKDSERQGEADIIVAKHRNGPVGEVVLTFRKEYPKFMNYVSDQFAQ